MRISIFTTITEPKLRQDPYKEALYNYQDLADEVVIVDGSAHKSDDLMTDKFKVIFNPWPEDFSWEFIGQQMQRGYEACTGDWVIRADCDYFFHEKDFQHIRDSLERYKDEPVASFAKKQFLLADRYNVKSMIPIAMNKGKFGDRLRIGGGGDLCMPLLDNKEIDRERIPRVRELIEFIRQPDVPKNLYKDFLIEKDGKDYMMYKAIPVYNYDFTFKTQDVVKKDLWRFARAWKTMAGDDWLGADSEKIALEKFKNMQLGRYYARSWKQIKIKDHPIYIQEKLKQLKPEMFGYNMWGWVEDKAYGK